MTIVATPPDYDPGDRFPAQSHEEALDRAILLSDLYPGKPRSWIRKAIRSLRHFAFHKAAKQRAQRGLVKDLPHHHEVHSRRATEIKPYLARKGAVRPDREAFRALEDDDDVDEVTRAELVAIENYLTSLKALPLKDRHVRHLPVLRRIRRRLKRALKAFGKGAA